MLHIDGKKALERRPPDKMHLASYAYIMQTVDKVNVAVDRTFQKTFNSFYRVRLPDSAFYNDFYRLLEQCKFDRGHLSYGVILDKLSAITGRVEASFSSKILATLNSEQPIWDSQVLSYLGLKPSGKTMREKLDNAKVLYAQIESVYAEYMKTEEAAQNIALFNTHLPEYAWFSDVKKIDFLLWALGDMKGWDR